MNLTFDREGNGHCLYTEVIPLQALGTLEVRRATHIEFNSTTQQWELRDATGALLFAHPARSCCLAWELENLNP